MAVSRERSQADDEVGLSRCRLPAARSSSQYNHTRTHTRLPSHITKNTLSHFLSGCTRAIEENSKFDEAVAQLRPGTPGCLFFFFFSSPSILEKNGRQAGKSKRAKGRGGRNEEDQPSCCWHCSLENLSWPRYVKQQQQKHSTKCEESASQPATNQPAPEMFSRDKEETKYLSWRWRGFEGVGSVSPPLPACTILTLAHRGLRDIFDDDCESASE